MFINMATMWGIIKDNIVINLIGGEHEKSILNFGNMKNI